MCSWPQVSTPGVWALPAGLLSPNVTHIFTVTVSKDVAPGAPPLSATASLSLRPRPSASAFPRGILTRQCGLAGCATPHNTDRPLTVSLVLDPQYTDATVSWTSPELPTLASLQTRNTTSDTAAPAGTHYLTTPPSQLPSNLAGISITASMALANVTGLATIYVPLNSAPACALAAGAAASSGLAGAAGADASSPCLVLEVVQNASAAFPLAAVMARVEGMDDESGTQDGMGNSGGVGGSSTVELLRYEFGILQPTSPTWRTAMNGESNSSTDAVQTVRMTNIVRQIGASSTTMLVGLPGGRAVTVYACAVDMWGARGCVTGRVEVTALGQEHRYGISAVLDAVDVEALVKVRGFTCRGQGLEGAGCGGHAAKGGALGG